jgi:hypothetical protein
LPSFTHRSVPGSQHALPPHADPRQQRCPGPPHASHVPELPHTLLALLQTFPLQQGCPGPPHVAQVEPKQTSVSTSHVRLGPQHGSAGPPHLMHVPPRVSHVALGALQVVPQHGSLMAPQPPQLPPLHTPPPSTPVQTWDAPTHRRTPVTVTQHPPLLHTLDAQHGSVTPPHAWQVAPLHAAVAWHDCPSQQGWPGAPQTRHVLPLHTRPAWQRRPAQHASPEPPHGAGGESGTPTSGMGCVESLPTSRGASCVTSGCVESGRALSTRVSFVDAVSIGTA